MEIGKLDDILEFNVALSGFLTLFLNFIFLLFLIFYYCYSSSTQSPVNISFVWLWFTVEQKKKRVFLFNRIIRPLQCLTDVNFFPFFSNATCTKEISSPILCSKAHPMVNIFSTILGAVRCISLGHSLEALSPYQRNNSLTKVGAGGN